MIMQSFGNSYPYTLAEAAAEANCKPQDLLHYAAHGFLSLLVRVPDDVFLHLYIERQNTWEIGNRIIFKPEFLVLPQPDCLQIELNGITKQCDFWEGYLFKKNSPRKMLPTDEYHSNDCWRLNWRTFAGTREKRLKITEENLLVMRDDLVRLVEDEFRYWHSNGKTILAKDYYSIDEAAAIANCDQQKVLNYAALGKIGLITGVPYNVKPYEYNDKGRNERYSFFSTPQIFALTQSHCANINTPGEHERCDFKDGYIINPDGQMEPVSHQYVVSSLNHGAYYWKTFQDDSLKHLDLTPKYLFVMRSDLNKLLELEAIANGSSVLVAGDDAKNMTHAALDKQEENATCTTINPDLSASANLKLISADQPWNIIDSRDPHPGQRWYTPARYFAREILKINPKLLDNRKVLADRVQKKLNEHGIYKRGGKQAPNYSTILKAFTNCNFK